MRKDCYDCAGEIVLIPAERILPNPLRQRGDDDPDELMASIAINGLLEPLTVRQEEEDLFRIVSGERRFRACVLSGMAEIPCILIDGDEQSAALFTLAHQQTRRPLHYLEEARLLRELSRRYGMTAQELSLRTGKPATELAEKLKLTELTREQQETLRDAGLEESFARLLLKTPEEERGALLREITENGWSLLQAKEYLQQAPASGDSPRKILIFKDLTVFTNTVEHAVNTMTRCGINASAVKEETESDIIYTVIIKKTG